MTLQALEYTICEGFTPPALSMLLTSIDVKYKGVGVGVLTFTYTIAGTIALIVDGYLISAFGEEPEQVGKVIAISTCIPCFFAAICFWIAGKHYEKKRQEQVKQTEKAIENVSAFHVSLRPQDIELLMSMKSFKGLTTLSYRNPKSEFITYLTSEPPKLMLLSNSMKYY
jgi:hypothetical protein